MTFKSNTKDANKEDTVVVAPQVAGTLPELSNTLFRHRLPALEEL